MYAWNGIVLWSVFFVFRLVFGDSFDWFICSFYFVDFGFIAQNVMDASIPIDCLSISIRSIKMWFMIQHAVSGQPFYYTVHLICLFVHNRTVRMS